MVVQDDYDSEDDKIAERLPIGLQDPTVAAQSILLEHGLIEDQENAWTSKEEDNREDKARARQERRAMGARVGKRGQGGAGQTEVSFPKISRPGAVLV